MTQAERLLAALRERPMTSLEIVEGLRIINTTGRISDLRAAGHVIECERDRRGHFVYRLRENVALELGL